MRRTFLSLLVIFSVSSVGCRLGQRESDSSIVPIPAESKLSNGLRVWFLEANNVPLVTVRVLVSMGSSYDPKGKEGLAAITADMLDEGAGERDALLLAEEVDFLGASLSLRTSKDYTTITIQTLRRNLDQALEILSDVVLRPRFEEKEWKRVHALTLNDVRQRSESATSVARLVGDRVFFSTGSVSYAHPVDGFESSVSSITLDDVRGMWRGFFRPSKTQVLVTGAVAPESLHSSLKKHFGGWSHKDDLPYSAPEDPFRMPPRQPHTKGRLVVVDKSRAPQTVIRIYHEGTRFSSSQNASMWVASTVLGGTFTSRLNSNLREDKKITYGARSLNSRLLADAYHLSYSSVQSDATALGLREFRKELEAMETGALREGELEKAKSSIRSRLISAMERQTALLRVYEESMGAGWCPNERQKFYSEISSIEEDDLTEVCAALDWSKAIVVLVGDRKKIDEALSGDLGLPKPEYRDRNGELILVEAPEKE